LTYKRSLNRLLFAAQIAVKKPRYAGLVKFRDLLFPILVLLFALTSEAHAITVRVSPDALERTLERQLFKDPQARYFIRGHGTTGCFIYAEDPKVSFREDRVVVHVRTHARLGTSMRGTCLGIGLNVEADVSLVPEAQGETIGFHDPRVENLSESRELNVFLEPFLSRKLPQEMKLNAADLLRQALATSKQSTGYDLKLPTLKISSMQVSDGNLVLDVDGDLEVH
jgi:hypothetical protein